MIRSWKWENRIWGVCKFLSFLSSLQFNAKEFSCLNRNIFSWILCCDRVKAKIFHFNFPFLLFVDFLPSFFDPREKRSFYYKHHAHMKLTCYAWLQGFRGMITKITHLRLYTRFQSTYYLYLLFFALLLIKRREWWC